MKIKARVRKMGKDRKVIEIPKSVRENFNEHEEVTIIGGL